MAGRRRSQRGLSADQRRQRLPGPLRVWVDGQDAHSGRCELKVCQRDPLVSAHEVQPAPSCRVKPRITCSGQDTDKLERITEADVGYVAGSLESSVGVNLFDGLAELADRFAGTQERMFALESSSSPRCFFHEIPDALGGTFPAVPVQADEQRSDQARSHDQNAAEDFRPGREAHDPESPHRGACDQGHPESSPPPHSENHMLDP